MQRASLDRKLAAHKNMPDRATLCAPARIALLAAALNSVLPDPPPGGDTNKPRCCATMLIALRVVVMLPTLLLAR